MKVVIAGGSGLVGRALARSLLSDGHEVVILTRDPARTTRRVPPAASVVAWSTHDVASLSTNLLGADAVVCLSGAAVAPRPWTADRKATIEHSRRDGVRAIVDAIGRLAPDQRPSTLVVASGVDAYPETVSDQAPFTERTPTAGGFLAEVTRVLEGEASRAALLDVRIVQARLGHVLGHEAKLVHLLSLPVRLLVGGRLGSGRQWVSWVHIDDVVGLIRLALERPAIHGVLNVVAPEPIRQLTFVRAIGEVLHRPIWFPTPAFLLRLVLGEEASLLLGSRRVISEVAADHGYEFRFPSIDGAMRDVLR